MGNPTPHGVLNCRPLLPVEGAPLVVADLSQQRGIDVFRRKHGVHQGPVLRSTDIASCARRDRVNVKEITWSRRWVHAVRVLR